MQTVFFNRTYDETMDMLVEARDYLSVADPESPTDLAVENRLAQNCEAMRLTSRLTQVMAWLLVQKAVHAGEMTAAEAAADAHRLSGQSVCRSDGCVPMATLPSRLRSLLDRSRALYLRVERLDALAARSALDERAAARPAAGV